MDTRALYADLTKHGIAVSECEPLAHHTTWRIGGPADLFVSPRTVRELQQAVASAHAFRVPVTVIGRGSNLLVLDGGVRGLVVQLHDGFGDIGVEEERLVAQAGRSFVSAAAIS